MTKQSESGGKRDHRNDARRGLATKPGIKGPLIFSAVIAILGGFVVMMASTGGLNNPDRPLRVDLGLIAAGGFFIVILVVISLMQLAAKDNPEQLSSGSGLNRSSEKMHREAVAKRRATERDMAEQADSSAEADGTENTENSELPPEDNPEENR